MLAELITVSSVGLAAFGLMSKVIFDVSRRGDEKIKRVYERVDVVKESVKTDMKEYVQAQVCTVRHEALQRDITEIKDSLHRVNEKLDKFFSNEKHG